MSRRRTEPGALHNNENDATRFMCLVLVIGMVACDATAHNKGVGRRLRLCLLSLYFLCGNSPTEATVETREVRDGRTLVEQIALLSASADAAVAELVVTTRELVVAENDWNG